MAVTYEWDCETVSAAETAEHEEGEVIDHSHGASFAEVSAWSAANPAPAGFRHALVLVRDDDNGRAWAYVEDGRLPDFFTDASGDDVARVPARFRAELARAAR